MTKNILDAKNISVVFGGLVAVNDVSFNIPEGSIVSLIGPNGAGKTTLLDLICGKTKATSGSIQFKEIELTKLSEHQIVHSGVGRKFQTPSIYEALTVFENLEMSFPRGRGVFGALTFKRTQDVVDRVHQVAKDIFLTDYLEMTADLLSHGQKQWLEIGMLLAQEPKLLLLDEPVAGMTDEETERTAELFLSLEGSHSLVVVEHDMKFIGELTEGKATKKVTVLHEGSVLAEGDLETVQNDPRVIGHESSDASPAGGQAAIAPHDALEGGEIGVEGELVGPLETDVLDLPDEVPGHVAEQDRLGRQGHGGHVRVGKHRLGQERVGRPHLQAGLPQVLVLSVLQLADGAHGGVPHQPATAR